MSDSMPRPARCMLAPVAGLAIAASLILAGVPVAAHAASSKRMTSRTWLGPTSPPPKGSELREEGREEGEEVEARDHWFYRQRAYPRSHVPPGAMLRAQAQARNLRFASGLQPSSEATGSTGGPAAASLAAASSAPSLVWSELGPRLVNNDTVINGTGQNDLDPPWSGRVSAIAPVNSQTVYAGGATGGVWKTVNGGGSWTPLFDTQSSLAIGALAVDPNNSSIVYAGTGESNASGDSYYGAGLFKSTDAGAHWSKVTALSIDGCTIADIAISPNSQTVLVAVKGQGQYRGSNFVARPCTTVAGIYRFDAGTLTWSHVTGGVGTDPQHPWEWSPTDLSFDSSDSNIAYAGFYEHGVFKSGDAGVNWGFLGTGQPASLTYGRVAVQVAPGNSQKLYAAFAPKSSGSLVSLLRSDDGGASWSAPLATGQYATLSLGWYALTLAVDPQNANTFYVGSTYLMKCTNGGANPGDCSFPMWPKLHVDFHALAFDSAVSPSNLWIGNDGGVYRTGDGLATDPVNRNTNLSLTQFQPGMSGTADTMLLGGTQDNGTQRFSGTTTWDRVLWADGGYSAVDPSDSSVAYMTTQHDPTTAPRYMYKSVNGNASLSDSGIPTSESSQFYPPLEMSPSSSQTLYTGLTKLYTTTNGAGAWAATSAACCSSTVSAIGPSGVAATIYVGTSTGDLKVTTNGGASWPTSINFSRYVTDIAVDPTNDAVAYLTLSGFGTSHVYKTTNRGGSWSPISTGLPDSPANSIAVDWRRSVPTLYVGTDVGVFWSTDGGSTWQDTSVNLPHTVVIDVLIDAATDKLIAATHGRGAFSTPIPDLNSRRGTGVITFSSNRDGDFDIYQQRADGTGLVNLTNGLTKTATTQPSNEFDPAWSPNGTQIAFESDKDDSNYDIYKMNSDGTSLTRLTTSASLDENADWSPDGASLTWDENKYIWKMASDGSSKTQLTTGSQDDVSPAWSPDGTKIVFASNRDFLTDRPKYEIYKMNADGSSPTRLTADGSTSAVVDQNPDWTSVGDKITWDRDGNVWTMSSDGTGKARITKTNANDGEPIWSPEADRIVFTSDRDGGDNDIYTMNAGGTGQTNMTNNSANDLNPTWKPDPYSHPAGASTLTVSLVPDFRQTISGTQCSARGGAPSTHGLPLNKVSCNPPAFVSGTVAHLGAKAIVSAQLTAVLGNLATVADEADITLIMNGTDVRSGSAAGADYNPNASGPDLTLVTKLRISDTYNGSSLGSPATVMDTDFSVPVNCATTADTTIGAACSLNTTADAVTPGMVKEGKTTVLQTFRIRLRDSGTNGTRGDADDRGFAMQGIYIR
jgi:photosystem II stability/assembly factor-like uncharacterized protein